MQYLKIPGGEKKKTLIFERNICSKAFATLMHNYQSHCKTVLVKGLAANFLYVQSYLTASKFVSLIKRLQNTEPLTLKRTPLLQKTQTHQTPKHEASCTKNQELLVGTKLKGSCLWVHFRTKERTSHGFIVLQSLHVWFRKGFSKCGF